jgi:hypothetical protein
MLRLSSWMWDGTCRFTLVCSYNPSDILHYSCISEKERCNIEWAILGVRYCSCQIGSQSYSTCGEGLLTARSMKEMGVIAWAVRVCKKIWVCVLFPVHNFYSTLCFFWHAPPYIVCSCMCLTMVSCLRQCHCIVQVFCEELCVCSVSSGNTEQTVHSHCL